jgi:hypothetical protein
MCRTIQSRPIPKTQTDAWSTKSLKQWAKAVIGFCQQFFVEGFVESFPRHSFLDRLPSGSSFFRHEKMPIVLPRCKSFETAMGFCQVGTFDSSFPTSPKHPKQYPEPSIAVFEPGFDCRSRARLCLRRIQPARKRFSTAKRHYGSLPTTLFDNRIGQQNRSQTGRDGSRGILPGAGSSPACSRMVIKFSNCQKIGIHTDL